jgi:tetratricopeptide (TPR) repeat protein
MTKINLIRKTILMGGVLPIFITGCTGLSGTQPPAPVYTNNRPYNAPMPKQAAVIIPKAKADKIDDVIQIIPLADTTIVEAVEIKPEPIAVPVPSIPSIDSGIPKVIEVQPPSRHLLMPTAPTETGVPKFEPAAPIEFKPAESGAALSPAVSALVTAANQSTKSGDIESAAAAIERAIRIDPRNGELLYKLAVLRLKQSKPILAEDLAKKAALLAGKDNTLKKNSWLLIAHAKEMQSDTVGAAEASAKAAGF